ncbi:hypothetical protein [Ancylobacter polymorphus]|jgi:hypothetical protein|uniref:Uncharacterized protein n=1 Tax=Ancylobacter polymorphus TaxID=223390 RepID=A0A9E6ZX66_9HYPH|nr:hypothetical protein [Ancylobacter polymorphus]UOK70260.1 hypothetical protein K9D25_16210 [Ancylobacter polymorphus]
MKVKIFRHSDSAQLETVINGWLEQNPAIEYVSADYQMFFKPGGPSTVGSITVHHDPVAIYSVLLWYR